MTRGTFLRVGPWMLAPKHDAFAISCAEIDAFLSSGEDGLGIDNPWATASGMHEKEIELPEWRYGTPTSTLFVLCKSPHNSPHWQRLPTGFEIHPFLWSDTKKWLEHLKSRYPTIPDFIRDLRVEEKPLVEFYFGWKATTAMCSQLRKRVTEIAGSLRAVCDADAKKQQTRCHMGQNVVCTEKKR